MEQSRLSRLARRLDLAKEATELLRGEANIEISGVSEQVREQEGVTIHTVNILNRQGAAQLGRPPGRYITVTLPAEPSSAGQGALAALVAEQLTLLLPPLAGQTLLMAGLGNHAAAADSLGPRAAQKLWATRQLFAERNDTAGLGRLAALCPGVQGESGLEAAELLAAVCGRLRPAALLVVDALAAADMRRVGLTIQLADTGISPGSGVGNRRAGIDQAGMGCPVVAMGVPTVVDSAAIIRETVRCMDRYRGLPENTDFDDNACDFCEKSLLSQFNGRLMVTPKDIDQLVADMAELLAAAIAIAVHPAANSENYADFIK